MWKCAAKEQLRTHSPLLLERAVGPPRDDFWQRILRQRAEGPWDVWPRCTDALQQRHNVWRVAGTRALCIWSVTNDGLVLYVQ